MRRDAAACPPGGETHAQCSARAIACFEDIVARHAGERVLVVSHNLTIYHLLRHVLSLRDDPQAPLVFFQIDNCALHRFARLPSGVWKVVALNERIHLRAGA